MTAPSKLTAKAVLKIKRDWIAGASTYDLAAEHNVSHTAILYHVEGLERDATPPMGRPRSFDHAKAVKLLSQGLRACEVAERMGVSRARISQITAHSRHNERKAAA